MMTAMSPDRSFKHKTSKISGEPCKISMHSRPRSVRRHPKKSVSISPSVPNVHRTHTHTHTGVGVLAALDEMHVLNIRASPGFVSALPQFRGEERLGCSCGGGGGVYVEAVY